MNEKVENKANRNSLAERILWMVIIITGIAFFLASNFWAEDGRYVQVRVSGQIVAQYPLSEDNMYEIEGKDGGRNVLVIEEGLAYIKEADCPDKLCVKHSKISKKSQSIVCLPNEVVIEIVNDGGDEIDAVTK